MRGSAPDNTRPRYWAAALAIGVLALAAYANSFGTPLIYDSKSIVELDPRIQTWNADTLSLIFTRNYWWPEHTSNLYRPVTTLTYWANYTLLGGGAAPSGYHLVNFALHWLNASLLLAVALRLGAQYSVACLAAAIFAVHPVATEGVTNIVGRADLLATVSVLGAGLAYIRGTERSGAARVRWLALAGGIALLGVLAKETAVAIGAFVVLYDWMFRLRRDAGASWRATLLSPSGTAVLRDWIAFAPAALLFVAIRVVFHFQTTQLGESFVTNPIVGAGPLAAFLTAWKVIGRYVALLVFPRTLSADYSYNQIPIFGATDDVWENAQGVVALVVGVALVALALRSARRAPVAVWGGLFFAAALLPTSNLIVRIGSIMGERFLYLPSLGFALASAAAVGALAATVSRRRGAGEQVVWGAAAALVVALGIRTHLRNRDWSDDLTFWRAAMRTSPQSYGPHAGYAAALLARSQDEATADSAIAHAERARAILENPPLPIEHDHAALLELGVYYRIKAQRAAERRDSATAGAFLNKSLGVLERARTIDEWFDAAIRERRIARGHPAEAIAAAGNYTLYLEIGNTHLERREWSEAKAAAQRAQRLMPDAAQAHLIEGVALFYARHPDSAAVAVAAALMLDGRNREHWDNLAQCFAAMNLPPPIVEMPPATPGGATRLAFDFRNPYARQLLEPAAARLVARYDDARRPADATRWRARIEREYGIRVP